MNPNWKAGDRALCIKARRRRLDARDSMLHVGTVYLVTAVEQMEDWDVPGLFLAGHKCYWEQGDTSWESRSFRQIVPACDRPLPAQKPKRKGSKAH
jgi:hypothetical protein